MELLIVLALSFVIRLIFILGETSDTFVHIWFIQKSKKNKFGKHKAFNSMVKGDIAYPSFPHFIISLFPEKYSLRVAYFLNIFYDCINITIFYFIVNYLFGSIWGIPQYKSEISASFLSTLIYATSPILFPLTARLKSIGGRTFGGLIAILYFLCFAIAFVFNVAWLYPICVFLGIIIILSSQFGMQAVTFISFFLSILYASIVPFGVILITFGIGIIIKPLGIRKILSGKINHYIWYFRNFKNHPQVADRNRIKDIIMLPYYLFKEPLIFFDLVLTKITPLIALISIPVLWLILYYSIKYQLGYDFFISNVVLKFLTYFFISSTIVFILTSFKKLLFLGQAERYFEYSISSLSIVFVYIAIIFNISIMAFLSLLLVHWFIISINFLWIKRKEIKESIDGVEKEIYKLVDFLATKQNLKILFIPTKYNFLIDSLLNKNDFEFYYFHVTSEKIDGFKYMESDEIMYGLIKPDFDHFKKKYKATTLIISKPDMEEIEKRGIKYEIPLDKVIYENQKFAVFDIDDLIFGQE